MHVARLFHGHPSVPAARFATTTIFLVNGFIFSNWVPRIPTIQQRLHLSNTTLGVALWGIAIGAICSQLLTGWLITRLGSRLVLRAAWLLYPAALILPALATNLPTLILALVAFGGTNGMLDVAMNTHGVAVERLYNRPIFSSLHAAFSGGCLIGAVCGGIFASHQVAPSLHFLLIAVTAGGIGLSACHWLLPTARPARPDSSVRRAFSVPRLSADMLLLGIIAFCDLLGEGSAADWSAVYLHGTLHTSAGLAAAGFAAFSLTMALGRLTGDHLTHRWGPALFVRGSSLLAGVGLTLVIAIPNPYIVIAGYALFGAGVACIFPTILSATGRKAKGPEASAIATVSTLGYTGFLSGPPLIGLLAGWLTLRAALGAVIILMLISALLSKRIGGGWQNRAQVS